MALTRTGRESREEASQLRQETTTGSISGSQQGEGPAETVPGTAQISPNCDGPVTKFTKWSRVGSWHSCQSGGEWEHPETQTQSGAGAWDQSKASSSCGTSRHQSPDWFPELVPRAGSPGSAPESSWCQLCMTSACSQGRAAPRKMG